MTNNKQQTAVEWLVEKLQESGIPLMTDEFEMIQQAKEMEKEQIKEAYRSFNCFFPSEYNIDDEDCILMMKIAKNTLNKHTEVTNDTARKSKRNLL
jgi:hypothetical protein